MSRCIRVLIIDDSQDDALLIADELAEHEFSPECLRIETPEAMADALAKETWDIIIADYTMPDFSGPEALQLLRQAGQDIPLILVSGTAPNRIGIDMMRAGAKDFILKSDLSRLSVAVEREIIEAEERRKRRQAEAALREAEAHRIEFYRRTIFAATDGKLVICEREQIESIAGDALASWELSNKEALGAMRDNVKQTALEQGMEEAQIPLLLACVVEAGANVIKHAGQGHASLHRIEKGLLFKVSDSGPGIGALALPDVALIKGYSTAGTLGMGYKIMLDTATRVYLSTGSQGTSVACEVSLNAGSSGRDQLLDNLSGWLGEHL